MNKTSKKIITFALVFVSLVLSFFGGYFVRYFAMDSEQRAIYDLIQKYKKYYYFDDGDLVKDISDAILDEYSEYFTKKEYIEILNGAKGNYSGIGISFEAKSLKIVGVIGNSPAEKAGVVKGGTLTEIAVDESFVKAQNFNNLSEILDSIPSEEEFKIKVRYGENTCEYTLSKQAYKRTYVHYYDNLGYYGFNDKSGTIAFEKLSSETIITNDTVGYIVYDSFNGTESGLKGSAKQIEHVLNKFKQDKKQNVILDLRDNGGGYMDILSEVSAHFINSNYGAKVKIAVAKDKYNNEEVFYSSKCCFADYNFKNIIILANENSASASEALIGAILDYDKNNIVKVLVSSSVKNGETVYKTYGKGIMQSTYVNADGSAVKLTTAEIFWPISNTSIHKVGLVGLDSGKILKVDKETALSAALDLLK